MKNFIGILVMLFSFSGVGLAKSSEEVIAVYVTNAYGEVESECQKFGQALIVQTTESGVDLMPIRVNGQFSKAAMLKAAQEIGATHVLWVRLLGAQEHESSQDNSTPSFGLFRGGSTSTTIYTFTVVVDAMVLDINGNKIDSGRSVGNAVNRFTRVNSHTSFGDSSKESGERGYPRDRAMADAAQKLIKKFWN
jgi:hypothetical protein